MMIGHKKAKKAQTWLAKSEKPFVLLCGNKTLVQ